MPQMALRQSEVGEPITGMIAADAISASIIAALHTRDTKLIDIVNDVSMASFTAMTKVNLDSKITVAELEPRIQDIVADVIGQVKSIVASSIRHRLGMLRSVHNLGATNSPVINLEERIPDSVDKDHPVIGIISDSVLLKLGKATSPTSTVPEASVPPEEKGMETISMNEIVEAIRNTEENSDERFALCSLIIERSKTDSSYNKVLAKAYIELSYYYEDRRMFNEAVDIMDELIEFQTKMGIDQRFIQMSRQRRRRFAFSLVSEPSTIQPLQVVEDETVEDESVEEEQDEDPQDDNPQEQEPLDLSEAPKLLKSLSSWINGVNQMSQNEHWHGRGQKLNVPNAEVESLCLQLDSKLSSQDTMCAVVENPQFPDLLKAMSELLNGERIAGRHVWNTGLADQIISIIDVE